MKRDMKKFMQDWYAANHKKTMPILSFPIAQKMGLTVTELLSDSDSQAKGMKMLADQVDMAVAVTYMDLSIETEAFGGIVTFADNEVPNVEKPIVKTMEDAEALQVPKVGAARTGTYIEGCRKAVEMIDKPVLAGCIGPFSLVGRLMDITDVMLKFRKDPEMIHILLEKATAFITEYVKAYRDEAGANGICMAEPLAGLLPPKQLKEFSSEYCKRIINEVQDDNFIVIYHNCGSSTIKSVDEIVYCGASGYHFGNVIDMEKMMNQFPADTIAMGNIDPASEFCNGTPESIRKATLSVMEKCCKHKNFIISSGCDIPAHSPWKNINAFFAAVDEFYSAS